MPVLSVNMQETGRAQRIIERVLRWEITQKLIQFPAIVLQFPFRFAMGAFGCKMGTAGCKTGSLGAA